MKEKKRDESNDAIAVESSVHNLQILLYLRFNNIHGALRLPQNPRGAEGTFGAGISHAIGIRVFRGGRDQEEALAQA